jgi:hypothetical protein
VVSRIIDGCLLNVKRGGRLDEDISAIRMIFAESVSTTQRTTSIEQLILPRDMIYFYGSGRVVMQVKKIVLRRKCTRLRRYCARAPSSGY